jgi:hypothetical protein
MFDLHRTEKAKENASATPSSMIDPLPALGAFHSANCASVACCSLCAGMSNVLCFRVCSGNRSSASVSACDSFTAYLLSANKTLKQEVTNGNHRSLPTFRFFSDDAIKVPALSELSAAYLCVLDSDLTSAPNKWLVFGSLVSDSLESDANSPSLSRTLIFLAVVKGRVSSGAQYQAVVFDETTQSAVRLPRSAFSRKAKERPFPAVRLKPVLGSDNMPVTVQGGELSKMRSALALFLSAAVTAEAVGEDEVDAEPAAVAAPAISARRQQPKRRRASSAAAVAALDSVESVDDDDEDVKVVCVARSTAARTRAKSAAPRGKPTSQRAPQPQHSPCVPLLLELARDVDISDTPSSVHSQRSTSLAAAPQLSTSSVAPPFRGAHGSSVLGSSPAQQPPPSRAHYDEPSPMVYQASTSSPLSSHQQPYTPHSREWNQSYPSQYAVRQQERPSYDEQHYSERPRMYDGQQPARRAPEQYGSRTIHERALSRAASPPPAHYLTAMALMESNERRLRDDRDRILRQAADERERLIRAAEDERASCQISHYFNAKYY